MTWRSLLVAGMLVVLSFSVSIAHAGVAGTRDPFAKIGVAVPTKKATAHHAPQRYWPKNNRTAPAPAVQYNDKPFPLWLADFEAEAVKKGIPQSVMDDAFRDVVPNDSVVRLDRQQPEGQISFTDYSEGVLNSERVERGRDLMRDNADLLKQISATYHVPAAIIVALWGIETEFGANKGNFSLIQSLTTLAYEGRRAALFRGELMNALEIMRDEHVMASALTGSWAGAMGNCQFMPSTYIKYAVDWDQDGHRDIWNSEADALASIANYLHQLGWNENLGWATQVTLPENFPTLEADLYKAQPLKHWRQLGVTAQGEPLPGNDTDKVYMMYPGTPTEGAWMVTDNYHVLLKWNRSRYFASSVGLLADALKQ